MFGNMESIKSNLRIGQVFRQRVDIRGLHVHRGDRQALLLVHRSEISRKFFLCSSVHHCNQFGIVNVCQILVEFLKLCLSTLMRVGELFVQSASPWATASDMLMSTSCHLNSSWWTIADCLVSRSQSITRYSKSAVKSKPRSANGASICITPCGIVTKTVCRETQRAPR